MQPVNVLSQRLYNQHLSGPPLESAAAVVRWLGAMQAQEFWGAKWAIAQRSQSNSNAAIQQEFDRGAILRTHVMRPTWHFLSPEDIRWVLKLTAPRVHTVNGTYYRQLNIDAAVMRQVYDLLGRSLQGGATLTRAELSSLFQQAGISTGSDDRLRLAYLVMHAELDGVICSGPVRGKQHTYALLEERVPPVRELDPDEARAEWVRRFFAGHGPATLRDFSWWSGLSLTEAGVGLHLVKSELESQVIAGQTHWLQPSVSTPAPDTQTAYLLPPYDECFIAYKDRSSVLDSFSPQELAQLIRFNGQCIVMDSRVVGTWKRTEKPNAVLILLNPFTSTGKPERAAMLEAAHRYSAFLDLQPVITFEKG